MKRKLFCEISPFTYKISRMKNVTIRNLKNMLNQNLATTYSKELLPFIIYDHKSLIRRTLGEVDPQLQENKATNLSIAAPKISHILIKPNEEFSFWKCVGTCTKEKGYLEGLYVYSNGMGQGIGGGLCQMSNLIHWMVLHTPLEITEHHHHDQIDLFPDHGRVVPFGTGTSVAYNYVDYRFKNNTKNTYQLILYTTDKYLCGELRCDSELDMKYHIYTEDEHFRKEDDGIYRCGKVMRKCVDKVTGLTTSNECIKENHAKIRYDESFVLDKLRKC